MAIETRLEETLAKRERRDTAPQDVDKEGEEEDYGDINAEEDHGGVEHHVCRSMERSLRRQLASHCEGLRMEIKEAGNQVEKTVEDISVLVEEKVSRTTGRKNTDVKDCIDALLGSPTLLSQIAMTMLEQKEVIKTFALFAKKASWDCFELSHRKCRGHRGLRPKTYLG